MRWRMSLTPLLWRSIYSKTQSPVKSAHVSEVRDKPLLAYSWEGRTRKRRMKIYENYGFGKWREGCGTLRASGGDDGGGSEMVCVGCTRERRGVSPTLTGDHENRVTDYTAICVGNGQLHQTDTGDKTGALNCMHDQQAIIHAAAPPRKYIVRRLTPLECCRLQGFPDGWGNTLERQDMTDEEYRFWLKVRREKEKTAGLTPKVYTQRQMLSWYNKLHTDSAEYKMWGNGIALPCAVFVLGGVVEAVQNCLFPNLGE